MSRILDVQKSTRVLTIQSHVVSGYCGNKCATFPLQLLGSEVDVINSVQLSNHTQYRVAKGQICNGEDLDKIFDALKENKLLRIYDYIITGFAADIGYIESMGRMIKEIKEERSKARLDCIYTFDPVLGDTETGFYVPRGEQIAEIYIERLVPLADVITPNLFEARILTRRTSSTSSTATMREVLSIVEDIHLMLKVKIVALTSCELEGNKNELVCILSRAQKEVTRDQGDSGQEIWMIRIPKIKSNFYGTGDLFSALLTSWFDKTNFDLKISLENTVNTIQDIILDTHSLSSYVDLGPPHSLELRLVQNQAKIHSPSKVLQAERLN